MKPFQMNHIVHDVGWILLCPRKMATQYGYRENYPSVKRGSIKTCSNYRPRKGVKHEMHNMSR